MALRTVRVGPDEIYETLGGQRFGVVSEQRQANALLKAMTVVDFIGGHFTVVPGRAQTGLPGEMVTTELLIKWTGLSERRGQYEEPVSFEESGSPIFGAGPEPLADDAPPPEPEPDEELLPHVEPEPVAVEA